MDKEFVKKAIEEALFELEKEYDDEIVDFDTIKNRILDKLKPENSYAKKQEKTKSKKEMV